MTSISPGIDSVRPLSTHCLPCVLVVDDDATLRRILSRKLIKRGVIVCSASCGSETVETYCRSDVKFDLVLMDVNMPGTHGPEAFARMRLADPSVRCCFMTSDLRLSVRDALLGLGAVAAFGKPFASMTEFCEELRRLPNESKATAGEVTPWIS